MVMQIDFDLKVAYFNYLVELVCDKHHEKEDYILLLDRLHSIDFIYLIERDVNRELDGENLRKDFLKDEGIDLEYEYEFDSMDVTVLEVLIALAKRLSFQVDNSMFGNKMKSHFWEILKNLDVEKYSADNYKGVNIAEKIRIWQERKFEKNGLGSPFPLKHPENDQRKEEIWNQMNDYIWENYM